MAKAPPQGLFRFPGIFSILGGSFTLAHGTAPSYAIIRLSPQANFAAPQGTLEITYGGDPPIQFPDCKIDIARLDVGSGGQVWTLRIADRRWKWAFGEITGRYNLVKPGGRIDLDTEKSPQDLATLLLKEMGEVRFDVSQLPNETRPYVEWASDNPAEMLSRLCDTLGCRVVLQLDNRVKICRLGDGGSLPTARIMGGGFGFDPPEKPDAIKVVCAPTQYQARIILEAVGLDTDGTVKLIKDLSYNPHGEGEPHGWVAEYPETFGSLIGADTLSESIRALALRTVYRWYRIKEMATGDLVVPGRKGPLKDIRQILPLQENLLDIESGIATLGERYPQAMHATVYGSFYDNSTDPKTFVNKPAGTQYPGSFSIDTERGIVQFNEPVYLIADVTTDVTRLFTAGTIATAPCSVYAPAQLVLECVFNVHDEKTFQPERHTKTRKIANGRNKTKPKIIKREDLAKTVRTRYVSPTNSSVSINDIVTLAAAFASPTPLVVRDTITNELGTGLSIAGGGVDAGLDGKMDYYLDADEALYQNRTTKSYKYLKIMPISPDGKIHQVTWNVGSEGATTEASENDEVNRYVPSYDEKRLAQITIAERTRIKAGGKPRAD